MSGGSPIFIKTFDMLVWLLEHTKKFPKHQRFVMAQRMEQAALSFQDAIVWATKTGPSRRQAALLDADYHLERLKLYSRLAVQLRLSSPGQYEHLARMLDELGRLLGGWLKSIRGRPTPKARPASA